MSWIKLPSHYQGKANRRGLFVDKASRSGSRGNEVQHANETRTIASRITENASIDRENNQRLSYVKGI